MDNEEELEERDQGKQRKILLLLAPLFVILLVIQGPTLLGLVTGSDEEEAPQPAATADSATAATSSASAESALGADVANATPTEPVFVIVNSDLPPRADENELTTLSRFDDRDPFIPGVGDNTAGDEADEGSSAEAPDATEEEVRPADISVGGDGSFDETGGGTGDSGAEDPDSGASSSGGEAEIQVNGSAALVRVGSAFPAFDPVFRLESLAGDAVRIGLVRGSYSTGSDLVDVEPGETRTLISQPDGTRYRVRLVGIVN